MDTTKTSITSIGKDTKVKPGPEFADPLDMILLGAVLFWTYAGEYTRLMFVLGIFLLKSSAQKPLAGKGLRSKDPDAKTMEVINRLLAPSTPVENQALVSRNEISKQLILEEPLEESREESLEEPCDLIVIKERESYPKVPCQTPQFANLDMPNEIPIDIPMTPAIPVAPKPSVAPMEKSKSLSGRRDAYKRMRARAFRMHYQSISRNINLPAAQPLSRGISGSTSSDTLASSFSETDQLKKKTSFQYDLHSPVLENLPRRTKTATRKRRSVLGWLQGQGPVMDVAVDTIKKVVPDIMNRYLELMAVAILLDVPQKERNANPQGNSLAQDMPDWD